MRPGFKRREPGAVEGTDRPHSRGHGEHRGLREQLPSGARHLRYVFEPEEEDGGSAVGGGYVHDVFFFEGTFETCFKEGNTMTTMF